MKHLPNLLIVDDNKNNLLLLENILIKNNVNLIQALSGSEALEKTIGIELALAIIDVRMPKMNGFELAKKINEKRAGDKVPVIFLTAVAFNESDVYEGFESGAVDYIFKPVNTHVLKSKVRVFLDLFEQKQLLLESAARIKKSEALYHDLVETSQDLIWQCDAQGRYIYLNPSWEDVFGYRVEEMLGRKFYDFQDSGYARRDIKEFARLIKGKQLKGFETVHVGKSGNEIHLVFNAKLVRDENGNFAGTRGTAYDFTERKLAADAKIISEKRFKKLSSLTIEGLVLHKNGIAEDVNQSVLNMFGYTPEELIGKNVVKLLISEEGQKIVARKIKENHALPYEIEGIKKDGTRFPIEIEARNISLKDENKIIRAAAVRDITERKLAEKELKESEERYRGIIQNTSGCVAVYSSVDDGEDFVFVDFNPAAERTDKISRENVIGRKVTEVFPGVIEFGLFKIFQEVWKTGKPQHFPVSVYKDKRVQGYCENYVYKLSSGEIVAIYYDLTSQKKAEEELAKSEYKFRLLANNTHDWEYWIDPEGNYKYLSKSCKRITGYSQSDFYDNPDLFFKLVRHDYAARVKTHYHNEEEKKLPIFKMDFPIINRSGDLRWIEHNCTPVFDELGNFMGRRGNNRDITERKLIEAELLKQEGELRSYSVYFDTKVEEEKKRIAGNIHDGLGQLLTSLKMELLWVKKNIPKKNIQVNEKFDLMSKIIDSGVQMVQDITMELRPRMLDDLGLVATVQWELNEFQNCTGIKHNVLFEPKDFILDFDRSTTLFRILLEILTNIYRHSGASQINVNLSKKSDEIVLRVQDNGNGITSEDIKSSLSFGIIGIREKAKIWDGRAEIKGETGKGTIVTISLPF